MKLEQFRKLYKRCDRKYTFCGPYRTFNYDDHEVEGLCIDSEQIAISAYEIGRFENLKYIVIEDGLEKICSGTFYNTKVEEIKLPNSVKYIDKEALTNGYLRYLELPLHCLEFVNDNILTTTNIKIKDDRVICKAPADFIANYFPYDKEKNLYIENSNFNFKWFDYFPEIATLHISSSTAKFDYSGVSIPTTTGYNLIKPRFVKRIYLNKNNSNFIFKDHCLIDKALNIVLFIEMKPVIKLYSAFDTCEFLPDPTRIKYYTDPIITFDVSGSKFFKEEGGTIRNYRGSVVYINDEEEILLTKCEGFADNVLLNHGNLKRLLIHYYYSERLNIFELERALDKFINYIPRKGEYYCSSPIELVIPTDPRFAPLTKFNSLSPMIKVTVEDVSEPDEYLE